MANRPIAGEMSEPDARKFMMVVDPADSSKVASIEMIDTGKLDLDGNKVYALGSAASIPGSISSSGKLKPLEGATDVATGGTAESLNQFPITAPVHIVNETLGLRGDWTSKIATGDSLTISGSTGNDGVKTVVSAVYSAGTTTITFATGDIVDATVDGVVSFAEDKFMMESIGIQAKVANTNKVYIGGKDIAAGLGISLTAGEFYVLEGAGYPIDLYDIYIDVGTNGEGITWTLLG